MTDLPLPASAFTTEELHRCALRELGLRKRVYPNRIETGRMTAEQAAKRNHDDAGHR